MNQTPFFCQLENRELPRDTPKCTGMKKTESPALLLGGDKEMGSCRGVGEEGKLHSGPSLHLHLLRTHSLSSPARPSQSNTTSLLPSPFILLLLGSPAVGGVSFTKFQNIKDRIDYSSSFHRAKEVPSPLPRANVCPETAPGGVGSSHAQEREKRRRRRTMGFCGTGRRGRKQGREGEIPLGLG